MERSKSSPSFPLFLAKNARKMFPKRTVLLFRFPKEHWIAGKCLCVVASQFWRLETHLLPSSCFSSSSSLWSDRCPSSFGDLGSFLLLFLLRLDKLGSATRSDSLDTAAPSREEEDGGGGGGGRFFFSWPRFPPRRSKNAWCNRNKWRA